MIKSLIHYKNLPKYFWLILLITPLYTYPGNNNFPAGARSAGMANASVVNSDVWSLQHNQAGLAFIENFTASLSYENKYMMKELGVKSAAIAMPVFKDNVFGITINHFGFSLYSEQKAGIAYARKFGKHIGAGIQLDYLTTRIGEDYGTKSSIAAEGGFQANILPNMRVGLHIYNPNRAKLSGFNDERGATILRLGFAYSFSEKILLAVEAEKDVEAFKVFKAGIEYNVYKPFFLRGGISTNPGLNTFGFGFYHDRFRIDIAATMHSQLGVSPVASITFDLREKEKSSKKNINNKK